MKSTTCWRGARAAARCLGVAFLGLLVASSASLAATDQATSKDFERVRKSTAELNEVRDRIKSLQARMESDKQQRGDIARQLEMTERRISALVSDLEALQQETEVQRVKAERTRAQRDATIQELQATRGVLGAQVSAAYQMGRQEKTKLLLNQEDPARVGRMLTYYDYLNHTRIQRIEAIETRVQELAMLENDLHKEMERLKFLQAERQTALAKLESSRDSRRRSLSQLEREIASKGDRMQRLEKDEEALESMLKSLTTLLADVPIDLGKGYRFGDQKGKLPWPVKGRLLANYGQKKGSKLKWRGVWIGATRGTPVKAAARGRVAYVGWMHRYGLIVVLEHGDGYFTLYGHNESVKVEPGFWVDAGETISKAGDTGGHRQSGVYFEIRREAKPQNPRSWLRA